MIIFVLLKICSILQPINGQGCENTDNIGKSEWQPIIDCREELNLALTPPDVTSRDWRTSKFDPSNENQLWRQDPEGRIINKANGKVFTFDQNRPKFQDTSSGFKWSFNRCVRSFQDKGQISQKFQANYGSENRCLNTANRFYSKGSVLKLYPCRAIHPVNGCFKFKKVCNCGIANIQNRIVGGSETPEHKYPWMARLVFKSGGYCGATLISRQHVLTAAHCVVTNGNIEPKSSLSVDLGEHDYDNSKAVRFSISEITPYSKYMVGKHVSHYDIAILTLSSPVTFSRNISPVCLPADTRKTYAGEDAVTTGWGNTEAKTGPKLVPSNVLKEADVKIITNRFCNEAYRATDRFIGTEICAGTPKGTSRRQGICHGDSGGPLHVKENGRYTQVGVSSGMGSCTDPKIPSVYIRVGETEINDWIKEKTTGTQDSNC